VSVSSVFRFSLPVSSVLVVWKDWRIGFVVSKNAPHLLACFEIYFLAVRTCEHFPVVAGPVEIDFNEQVFEAGVRHIFEVQPLQLEDPVAVNVRSHAGHPLELARITHWELQLHMALGLLGLQCSVHSVFWVSTDGCVVVQTLNLLEYLAEDVRLSEWLPVVVGEAGHEWVQSIQFDDQESV